MKKKLSLISCWFVLILSVWFLYDNGQIFNYFSSKYFSYLIKQSCVESPLVETIVVQIVFICLFSRKIEKNYYLVYYIIYFILNFTFLAWTRIKLYNNYPYLLIVLIIGLVLMIISAFLKHRPTAREQDQARITALEEELAELKNKEE